MALALQCATTIHPDTSVDIARTESGFNPYAIGVVGGKGIYPKNINDALAHVNRLKSEGENYSIGLMQINQSNFKRFNVSPEELFNPCNNLSIYEKIITDCYKRGGTLKRALSCYYSGRFDTGQRPEKQFNSSYIQRVGYVVPSTKEDRQSLDTKTETPHQPTVIYPSKVIRGTFPTPGELKTDATYYPPQIVRGRLITAEVKE